jgi:NAD(P)H dehydrogenase (quinone)
VRLRHIAEPATPNPSPRSGLEGETARPPSSARRKRRRCGWVDAVIFGSPTRFGSPTNQFRAFGGLWAQGRLAEKVYAGFSSLQTSCGDRETTLLSLYISLMLFGGIIVARSGPSTSSRLPARIGKLAVHENPAHVQRSPPTALLAMVELRRRISSGRSDVLWSLGCGRRRCRGPETADACAVGCLSSVSNRSLPTAGCRTPVAQHQLRGYDYWNI